MTGNLFHKYKLACDDLFLFGSVGSKAIIYRMLNHSFYSLLYFFLSVWSNALLMMAKDIIYFWEIFDRSKFLADFKWVWKMVDLQPVLIIYRIGIIMHWLIEIVGNLLVFVENAFLSLTFEWMVKHLLCVESGVFIWLLQENEKHQPLENRHIN